MKRIITAIAAAVSMLILAVAVPANAEDGCQSNPILGLNPPQVRTICDTAINPDGSWMRIREYWYQHGQTAQQPADVIDSDVYTVTPDTIPAGEPGHLN